MATYRYLSLLIQESRNVDPETLGFFGAAVGAKNISFRSETL